MAEQVNSHSAMAMARHTDGLNVIFDQKSPGSSHSRSRSRSSSSSSSSSSSRSSRSSGSGHYKRRGRRDSSSSSSSSRSSSGSRSSSRSRSRSHPRCHRRSSRCRCDEHRGPVRRHYRRSPSRRYRAHSRSYSRSPTPNRFYRRRRYSRSRSRSSGRWSHYRRPVSPLRFRISPSPYRNYRSRSRSRTPVRAVSLSLDDKRKLLEAAKANAMKILGVEKIELPESVKPILSKQPEPRPLSPEPPVRRRRGSEETGPQDGEVEPQVSSPTMSTKRHIAFNTHNAMAKPTAAAPSPAKLTSRVDSFESRKPYGRWIPIGARQSALK